MRKQGLVHLHALCTLLREHLRNREEFPADAFERADVPASPAGIHRPKDEHRRAVAVLLADVAATVDNAERGGEDARSTDGGPGADGETEPPVDGR